MESLQKDRNPVEIRKMGKASDRDLYHVNINRELAEKMGIRKGRVMLVYDINDNKIIIMNAAVKTYS